MKNRAIQPRRLGKVAFYRQSVSKPPKKANKKQGYVIACLQHLITKLEKLPFGF